MIFKSTAAFYRITDISSGLLKKMNIKGLILDVDNTLATHDNPRPIDGVTEWISEMKKNDIRLIIVSNNHPPRVEPFAENLGIECVCEGKKPLPKGFSEAAKRLGLPKKQIAAVGDQIYTDVLGANLFGIKMFYVVPVEHEKTTFFKVKRKLEIPFLPKKIYRRRKNND